jgi:uncharacterized Zn-binding protein involved in type VI secretion
MAEPDEHTRRGPWEDFHRLRREQEQLEEEARAAADAALGAVGLPPVAELGERLDDAIATIEDALPLPERFRPHVPRPWETWRNIEHGVDWISDQLEPLREKLERIAPNVSQLQPPSTEPLPPSEPADDEGGLGDAVAWFLFLCFLDWLSRQELTIEHEIEGALWDFKDPGEEVQQWNKRTFVPEAGYAARLGDVMMHGDTIAPGLGSPNVSIGGKPGLRSCDSHVCTKTTPIPHVGTGFVPTQTKVTINGFPALRVGDSVNEGLHGLNPIVTGCLRVTIGPKPAPVDCWVPGETKREPPLGPIPFRWRKGQIGHFKGKVVLGLDIDGPFARVQGTVTAARLWAEESHHVDVPLGDVDGDGKLEAWRIKAQTKTTRALGISDVELEVRRPGPGRKPVTWKSTPKPNETDWPKTTVEDELVEVEP